MKEERKLTKSEEKRKEEFDKVCSMMIENGYKKHDITISVKDANTKSLIYAMPLILIFMTIYVLRNGIKGLTASGIEIALIYILTLVLIVVHELIHGITWSWFTKKGWEAISFGVIWKMVTPYCTCNEPLSKRTYITGALAPLMTLGILPAFVAVIIGSPVLLWVSQIMILGACGDIYMSVLIARFKEMGNETIFMDHPYEVGSVAFTK